MTNAQAIAHDLDLCDSGIAFSKGVVRRRYVAQRKACFAAIREMNRVDGIGEMSDAELFAELSAA